MQTKAVKELVAAAEEASLHCRDIYRARLIRAVEAVKAEAK